ncbi:alpha-ketoglutarate-dependent dioxygenase AlkB [Hahella sp. CCB-MM4]|uniref:alpha-ketoglutarate-dependent dioxygenase AlkB n=1 Tax=Hahella sp. (strain CCB-MM4) TaxID=1926491 RepID=UPI000B9B15F3|nr:alpha-ketoglutarate-dependent dioxygenase AlkB [Hahella sp. CCB-MM4]OZG70330.1 alpha-ketoglutarate-dependent dioxygenase AlkB [Hahella sp. CCB-MM4]
MIEPDILIKENFVHDADSLFDYIKNTVDWDERMKSRKTASFGVSYNYSGITYPESEMVPELEDIRKKIRSEIGFLPNNCLINYYLDGNSTMGYHSDSAEELLPETGVVIISLGAEREISYRSKTDKDTKFGYILKNGALLYMSKQVQDHWLHAIPMASNCGERISLTFRCIVK